MQDRSTVPDSRRRQACRSAGRDPRLTVAHPQPTEFRADYLEEFALNITLCRNVRLAKLLCDGPRSRSSARNDVIVAIALGRGLQRGEVRASPRFGKTLASPIVDIGGVRQKVALLFVGADLD
jgi:hypothetical protein